LQSVVPFGGLARAAAQQPAISVTTKVHDAWSLNRRRMPNPAFRLPIGASPDAAAAIRRLALLFPIGSRDRSSQRVSLQRYPGAGKRERLLQNPVAPPRGFPHCSRGFGVDG
jgi:hypothetical protein